MDSFPATGIFGEGKNPEYGLLQPFIIYFGCISADSRSKKIMEEPLSGNLVYM